MRASRQGVPILHDMVAISQDAARDILRRADRDVVGASEGPVGLVPEVRKDNAQKKYKSIQVHIAMPEVLSPWDCFLRTLAVGVPLGSLLYFVAITMRFFDVIPAWMLHAWIVTVIIVMSQLSFLVSPHGGEPFSLDAGLANALAKFLPRTSVVILPLGLFAYLVLWCAIFFSQRNAYVPAGKPFTIE